MNNLRSVIYLLLACALAHAAPPSKESIERLLIVTEAEKLVTAMPQQIETVMKANMDQALSGQVMPAEAREFAESFRKKMMAGVMEELSWPKMKDLYLEIYGETFTQEEIDGLIAFYESPAGKAFVVKMPLVMQKSMTAMQQRMGPIMQKMQASMKEALQEMQEMRRKNN